MKQRRVGAVLLGASFLMATSALGPGFLTQTTVFTKQLAANFGFVILLSVLLDIFTQLNIWRVLTVSGKRGQDIANEVLPGAGYVLAALVVFGCVVFNIGNIAGCGLGLNALLGIPVQYGAAASAVIAIGVFLVKEAGRTMDRFVKLLGVIMLGLIVYVVYASQPPLAEAAFRTIWPEHIDPLAVITLFGGTFGGYISFAGAHRLIDAGISGKASLQQVNKSAVTGIVLTALIRFMLFLAALGVIALGMVIDDENPAVSVFQNAAGNFGSRVFGIVMWAVAMTSVVGAAYTSVSFFKTFHRSLESRSNLITVGFVLIPAIVFLTIKSPVSVLVWAGTINGFILPIGLAIVLIASRSKKLLGDYRHPLLLQIAGWFVVLITLWFSISTLINI
jgi:Mn2+/Fe2+ NRAMP family transporter